MATFARINPVNSELRALDSVLVIQNKEKGSQKE